MYEDTSPLFSLPRGMGDQQGFLDKYELLDCGGLYSDPAEC